MTSYLRALLIIANHPVVQNILMPLIDQKNEQFYWHDLNYGVLSSGEKVAVSWALSLWSDEVLPADWTNSILGFGIMSSSLQTAVLKAIEVRHQVEAGLRQELEEKSFLNIDIQ